MRNLKNASNTIKFVLDFIPLILFFLAYRFSPENMKPTVFASLVLMISTVIAMLISKILQIKLEKMTLYSNIAVILFGGLTVIFDNPDFIKAKLTALNGLFAIMLLIFYFLKKPVIKSIFKGKIEMEDEKWNILNLRFAIMFFLIAILNFYFWKFTSENAWVNFKTFGVLPFIIIFFGFQIKFILKYGKSL